MKNLSIEAKVGAFVIAGLVGLGVIATTIEPLKYSTKKVTSYYYVIFDNVAGLAKEAPVMVAGVRVGKVDDIEVLPNGKAKVKIVFTKKVTLHRDAYAIIETMGLMGEKYVEVIPGSENAPVLASGATITRGKSTISTDQLMIKIYETVDALNKSLITPDGKNRIAMLLDQITKLTEEVTATVEDNRENLKKLAQNLASLSEFLKSDVPEIAENLKSLSAQLDEIVVENRGDIRDIVKNLKTSSEEAPQLVAEAKNIADKINATISQINKLLSGRNEENIEAAIENVKKSTKNLNELIKKLQEGNGTIAKIINDDTLYKNLTSAAHALGKLADKFEQTKVYIGFRGDVNTATGNSRGGISLKIVPESKDRYYLFEVVADSHGKIDHTTYYITNATGSVSVQEEVRQSFDTEFTLQYARIFNDPFFLKNGKWVLRGGIIETTAGGGIDYLFPDKKWKLYSSIWDIDRKDGYGKQLPPHLRIGLSYNINKNWYLYFGGDELLYNKWRGFFIGSGLVFGDDDVKYLMGSMPSLK
ncbi:MlaD family protein [Desulfurobacterium sp.]